MQARLLPSSLPPLALLGLLFLFACLPCLLPTLHCTALPFTAPPDFLLGCTRRLPELRERVLAVKCTPKVVGHDLGQSLANQGGRAGEVGAWSE